MLTLNKRGLGALVALTALVVSSAAFAADGKDGMKVVRDQVTGELRGPTPVEAQAMAAQEKAKAPAKALGLLTGTEPQQKVMKNGAVMMELTEESMVYSVVTRKADGSLDMQCVHGSDAAHKVVNGKVTKEHKHDK